jgi:hypothetical protein
VTDQTPPADSDIRDALNAALAASSSNPDQPLRLDGDECDITVPMPPGLIDGIDQLSVTVRISADIVSFISPLAALTEPDVPADAATALLRRQFFSLQTDGVGFAIADREDVLVAQYHWIPIDLTPEAFSTIFSRFVSATLRLRDEITRMASLGAPFDVL